MSAPSSVRRGQTFTITASGSAKTKSHLVFILDQNPCSSTYLLEYNNIGAWQHGDSYFQRGRGHGSRSLVSKTYTVNGGFNVSVTAHAGNHTGTHYVCAYLPSHKPSVTRAHASRKYRVS